MIIHKKYVFIFLISFVFSQANLLFGNIIFKIFFPIALILYSFYESIYFEKKIKWNIALILFLLMLTLNCLRSNAPVFSPGYTLYKIIYTWSIFFGFSGLIRYLDFEKKSETIYNLIVLPCLVTYILILFIVVLGIGNVDDLYPIGETNQYLLTNILNTKTNVLFILRLQGIRHILGFFLVVFLTSLFIVKNKIFYTFVSFSLVIILLILDSRIPLIAPFISLLTSFMIVRSNSIFRKLLLITLLSLGFFLLILISLIFYRWISSLDLIARNSTDLITFSKRIFIWGPSLDHFVSPKTSHFFGYGPYGSYFSGASKKWAYIFSDEINSDLKTSHNLILTTLFDYGYLGVLITINYFKKIIWEINELKTKSIELLILNSVLLYIILTGQFESFTGYYNRITPVVLIMFSLTSHTIKSNNLVKL